MTSDSNRGLASADEETKERVAREVGKALLGFLSDDILKQAQSNTVVVQQEKVDRVGFEPTTSASLNCIHLKGGYANRIVLFEIPTPRFPHVFYTTNRIKKHDRSKLEA